MQNNTFKHFFKSSLRNLQTVLSVAYLLMIGVGMLFSYMKYKAFGINIFNYADIFDFLITPFSDPRIIFFTFITILLVWIFFSLDLYTQRKLPKLYSLLNFGIDKKDYFKTYRMITYAILSLFYLILSADRYAFIVEKEIRSNALTQIEFSDDTLSSGQQIGKTKDVVFLLEESGVYAYPMNGFIKNIKVVN